ncbi:MAG: rhamnosyltransferase [Halieaceae bacterium]|jgi:rhamnosyltransferase
MAEVPQVLVPPSTDNTALVVITYKPDGLFIERIQGAASQFGKVVLVDNSESEQLDLRQLDPGMFDITRNGKNIGLAKALNLACERAKKLGFDWVITLDQDTELYPGFFPGMLDAWSQSSSLTALLGSNYYNVSRSAFRVPPMDLPHIRRQTTVITSGCLMHLPTWSAIGMFRGDYFIDSIDHEFCLRVRQAGFVVAINSRVGMKHVIGNQMTYLAPIARFAPYRHSVGRKYTRTRNSLRTIIDYGTREPRWCAKQALGMLVELIAIIILEPDKRLRLRAFSLGLLHGWQGKLGSVPAELKSAQ